MKAGSYTRSGDVTRVDPQAAIAILKAMGLDPDPGQERVVASVGVAVTDEAFLLLTTRCATIDDVVRYMNVLGDVPLARQAALADALVPAVPGNN